MRLLCSEIPAQSLCSLCAHRAVILISNGVLEDYRVSLGVQELHSGHSLRRCAISTVNIFESCLHDELTTTIQTARTVGREIGRLVSLVVCHLEDIRGLGFIGGHCDGQVDLGQP